MRCLLFTDQLRLLPPIRLTASTIQSVCRTLSVPQIGRQVLGAILNVQTSQQDLVVIRGIRCPSVVEKEIRVQRSHNCLEMTRPSVESKKAFQVSSSTCVGKPEHPPRPSCSTEKSWPHFRPPPVYFCGSR